MGSLPFRSLLFASIAVLLIFANVEEAQAKRMTRCEVALQLQRAGISRTFIGHWLCLMETVSNLRTDLVVGPQRASSYSYGIFQITSNGWCARGRRGGICNMRCEDLANDNISDDIQCAKQIYNLQGFRAWDAWTRSCKNKPPSQLPNFANCRRR
ncbi:lysozyme-like [Neodiprion virginianus]|uniref:lysozyme-like n=1 Tax=Neodiprion fabricii TaxID=2872261 RepID=UPI001ED8E48B|nr:lysozyme-like [Neodiprion fabricii]XP_046626488.1 lysozyme-like [Neodiprion virginianus]